MESKINEEDKNEEIHHNSINSIEVHFSPESSSLYCSTRKEAKYEFDYEVNLIHFAQENGKECMYIKHSSKLLNDKYIKIDPETNLCDTINFPYSGDENILNNKGNTKLEKANIFKRLVSKKKRRLQTEFYDLDMAYITERVIGMGFPAYGYEILFRNDIVDLKSYLDRYHSEYKIYNLCIEKSRIYPKDLWVDKKVGLFPFSDHAPCPIKLILDFCIDLCLYLTSNPNGVAAIHCKAGKGRTGVMIVSYLLFSGLCQTSEEALAHYASQRTLNNKGVTIPSQIRYIKYFESFLSSNYERPYLRCIPKIIKIDINKGYNNMIMNYNNDPSYFFTINSFILKKCIIGPFSNDVNIQYDFAAITRKNLNFEKTSKISKKKIGQSYYYEIETNSNDIINYDLKLEIKGKKIKFYSWFNLWFNTFEIINQYILDNNYFGGIESTVLSQNEMNDGQTNNSPKPKTCNSISKIIQEQYLRGIEKQHIDRAFSKVITKYSTDKRKKTTIESLKTNKDLNVILNGIDELAKEKGIPLIDRDNLEFTIEKKELDKLKTEIKDDFKVKYTFQLLN